MDEVLKNYEETIKKKHSFAFTPKYKEVFPTSVNKKLFIPIVVKTFENLGWELAYQDDETAEARRKKGSGWVSSSWSEYISVTYSFGVAEVTSKSLGNEMWDMGRNSKRVKLFIFAFEQTLKSFDSNSLRELEKETEIKNNWDDYIIPETLPQPIQTREPNFTILIIGGIITSLLLGFVVAFLSLKGLYIIGLFEVLVSFAMIFVIKYLIRISNFTGFTRLQYLIIAMVVLTYVSNQYFQYELILKENNYDRIDFWEFMKLRISAGLTIKKLNVGWIGLIISWIVQLVLTYSLVYSLVVFFLIRFLIARVPGEVVDFACYHYIKSKSEEKVRKELSKKGWSGSKEQDYVLEALANLDNASELNRVK